MVELSIEDLPASVGLDLGHSRWLDVTQDLVDRFADLVDDHAWMHVDVERATQELGGTIAHGNLTLSMISQLGKDVFRVTNMNRGVNYGWERVRFITPVHVGKRIRVRQRISGVEAKADGTLIHLDCSVEIEGVARPACVAERLLIVYAA